MNKSGYLIQYLRKSKLVAKNTNLAEYLNSVLTSIIGSQNNDYYKYKLEIYGSCWGHSSKLGNNSVTKLIDTVFRNVPTSNLSIYLCNGYHKFKPIDIKKELKNRGYKNVGILSPVLDDHAKIVTLFINNTKVFLMIGSTNFSKNSYIDPKTSDQCDVAFIRATKSTVPLIAPIVNNPRNGNSPNLINLWRDTVTSSNSELDFSENIENDYSAFWNTQIIPTFPFIGENDEIFI